LLTFIRKSSDQEGREIAYVSLNYDHNADAPFGTWVSDPSGREYGQCVSFAKVVAPSLPATTSWIKGDLVKGKLDLVKGTVIATFNGQGHYSGHTAIYDGQSPDGIYVVDQWITPPPKAIGRRLLRFGAHGRSNDGNGFYIVQ